MPVVMAVNREYVPRTQSLAEGDELALIPPVSGGAIRAPSTPRDRRAALARGARALVGRPAAGAIVTFQGDHARRRARSSTRPTARWRRSGSPRSSPRRSSDTGSRRGGGAPRRGGAARRAERGVAVSAAHREEAFAGAREIIDRIKAEAPIWKKEIDGGASGGSKARAPGRWWTSRGEGSLPSVEQLLQTEPLRGGRAGPAVARGRGGTARDRAAPRARSCGDGGPPEAEELAASAAAALERARAAEPAARDQRDRGRDPHEPRPRAARVRGARGDRRRRERLLEPRVRPRRG